MTYVLRSQWEMDSSFLGGLVRPLASMSSLQQLGPWDILYCVAAVGIVFRLLKFATASLRGVRTTSLRGPASKSILFGVNHYLNFSPDSAAVYEQWANEYGPAFKVPGGFGSYKIMILDPKANAHFYSKETFGYVQTELSRVFIENLVSDLIMFYNVPANVIL